MGLFDLFKKKTSSTQVTPEHILGQADALVNQFKDTFALDFSVTSLETLDNLLGQTADSYNTQMDEAARQNFIAMAGSYIFEVARRNFGGSYFWYDRLQQPILVTGQPEFEMSLLAYEKVKGRLENGEEDNIPFFFAGYVEGVENRQSAMVV